MNCICTYVFMPFACRELDTLLRNTENVLQTITSTGVIKHLANTIITNETNYVVMKSFYLIFGDGLCNLLN